MKNIYKKIGLTGALGILLGFVFACTEEEPLNMAPTFKMNEPANIMRTSVKFSGSITGDIANISEYGFDYSLSEDFTGSLTTRKKVGETLSSNSYELEVTGLEANERYYYRMYASTGASTVFSASEYFQTLASSVPTFSQLVVDSIGENVARFKCTIEEIGDEYLIEYGVGYKTSADKTYIPIPSDSIVPVSIAGAANTYFVEITGLEPATRYSFRPYAKNSADANGDTGTREGYGTILEQQTENQLSAVVETAEIMEGNVGINSVTVSGRVESAIGSNGVVDVCGFCWSATNQTPSIVDSHMEVKVPNLGEYFTGTITDLQPGMTYFVRAYAKNTVNGSERIGYGAVYEITTTTLVTPVLEWSTEKDEWGNQNDYQKVTPSTIRVKANIKNYDESALIEKGLIWDKVNGQLSIEEARKNKTYLVVEGGANVIDGTITKLEMNTNYYVRAYAIYKAAGMEEIGYTPWVRNIRTEGFARPDLDNVEVPDEDITRNSAKLIGRIASAGNGVIKERGFCLSLVENTYEPTITNCDIHVKSDETFISTVKNLKARQEYAVRAYAISTLENKTDTTYCGWRTCFWTKEIVLPSFNNVVINEELKTYNSITLSTKIVSLGDGTLKEKGFIWSKDKWDLTFDNADGFVEVKENEFAATISKLKPSTNYKFRAYAKTVIDNVEYISYSDRIDSYTHSIQSLIFGDIEIPEENITRNSVKLIGSVSSEGTGKIIEQGFCLSLAEVTSRPEFGNCKIQVKTDNSFVTTIHNLKYNTRYSARAYAITTLENVNDTVYSGSHHFWTKELVFPTFNNVVVNEEEMTATSIPVSSKIVTLGDGILVEKGFVWATDTWDVTLENAIGSIKVEEEEFKAVIKSLTPSTHYKIRAYAKVNIDNEVFVRYSDTHGISTSSVQRPDMDVDWENRKSDLTSITIPVKISDKGEGVIVEQGFYWKENKDNDWNISFENNDGILVVSDGTDKGFTGTITGLMPSTGYHIVAYMKMKLDGYEYVHETGFGTSTSGIDLRLNVSEITDTTCKVVGNTRNLNLDGVTEYGFCWSTDDVNTSEMKNQIKASEPDENGDFTVTIENLTGNTQYYISMYIVYKDKKIYQNGRWQFTTKRMPSINDNTSPDKKD